jgi:hypothetical protein
MLRVAMTDTLIGHLALKFHSHPENLAIEGLGFLLKRSQQARKVLRDLLAGRGVSVPDGLLYETQGTDTEDGSRPDLIGCDGDGQVRVVLEAKFWAGLTINQPVTYLGRLPAQGGALVFVLPAARMDLVWSELIRRCEDAGLPVSSRAQDGEVRAATVGPKTLIALSWRELLERLHRSLESAGDHVGSADVTQLRGLADRMDSERFLPVTSEELTSQSFRRVVEFGGIVDDAAVTLIATRIATEGKRWKHPCGNGFYGRYLGMAGVGVALLCDVRKWMAYASTPMWLSIYGPSWGRGKKWKTEVAEMRKYLGSLESATPPALFIARDGFPAVPLFVPVGRERPDIVAEIVNQVAVVANLLSVAFDEGNTAPEEPPPDA